MRSNNPVFNNNPAFNGQAGYGQQGYPQQGYAQAGYPPPPPGAPQYGAPQNAQYGLPQQTGVERPMTIDDVVQKTGLSLGVVVAVAAALWLGTGNIAQGDDPSMLIGLTTLGMFGGLAVGLIASFKRSMLSPALVLAYAALEGLFMGGISKIYHVTYTQPGEPSIVLQALLGTVFAAGGVLAAYKFFDIKVNDKFRKGFFAAAMGFMGIAMLEFVLSMFGNGLGLFENGAMGLIFAIAGLGFGVVGLIMDFDMVENGLRAGVPEKFAWTAAFGLTASLVMVYFYILRILAILQSDD